MQWLKATGILSYHTTWIVVRSNFELVRYYAWWFNRKYWKKPMYPKHGAHVCITRGAEEHIEPGRWQRKLNVKEVEFEYSPQMQWNDWHVWLRVRCKEFEKIRKEYGLSKQPPFGFHLTIGRLRINESV